MSASAAATAALSARAASNNVNGNERNNHSQSHSSNNNSSSQNIPTVGNSAIAGVGVGAGDQHSALMDEFKRAHQRMFKNGFQETERKVSVVSASQFSFSAPLYTVHNNCDDFQFGIPVPM